MGSWDPTMFGMAPIKYVGSNFSAGKLSDGKCVSGFDNAAFVMGTSSSLFNSVIAEIFNTKMRGILAIVSELLNAIAQAIDHANDDIASWTPNPFRGWNPSRNKVASHKVLGLVDGGEDFQNIPLYPHMQKARKVDVIFAIDSSADTGDGDGWPNGTSLVATYQRHTHGAIRDDMPFPAIPDTNTIVNLGLNTRPTFFGCDPKNISGQAPLIVYIPNYPYTYYTNFSTATASISKADRDSTIRNGYNVATMGNGTLEKEWTSCVGCAILSRSFYRTGTTPPSMCQSCFKKHCWDGTLDPTPPKKFTPVRVIP
jgi:lysophospholipase